MDSSVFKVIFGLVLGGAVFGTGLGLVIGRSNVSFCPPSMAESGCPDFLKPRTALAAPETGGTENLQEEFYRGAYAQCVIMGALSGSPNLTRERLAATCIDLTGAVYRNDVYSKDLQGWEYSRVTAEQVTQE